MSLDIPFRNAVRSAIKRYCKGIMNGGKPSSQAKAKWKFENSADWHYGHFVGTMGTSATAMYFTFFKELPNEDQVRDIEDIIEEESKELREYFKKNYND